MSFEIDVNISNAAPGLVAAGRLVNGTINTVWSTFPIDSTVAINTKAEYELYATTLASVHETKTSGVVVVHLGTGYTVNEDLTIAPSGSSVTADKISVTNDSDADVVLVLRSRIKSATGYHWRNVWTSKPVANDETLDIFPTSITAVWLAPPNTLDGSIIPGALHNFVIASAAQTFTFVGDGTAGIFGQPRGFWIAGS